MVGLFTAYYRKSFINSEQEKVQYFSLLNNSGDLLNIISCWVLLVFLLFFSLTVLILRQHIYIWEENGLSKRVPEVVNFCLTNGITSFPFSCSFLVSSFSGQRDTRKDDM